jgi:DHA1 family quinolone resistance protein-like MFS transporter
MIETYSIKLSDVLIIIIQKQGNIMGGERVETNKINNQLIRILTYLMFMMFAMTTDAVGVIIPEIIKEFNLTHTQASAFHYGPMIAIAASGMFLGFLADRLGRKVTIIIGLSIFSLACGLFVVGNSFSFFLFLLVLSGTAIGIFKTAALALVGDITTSNADHTRTMNLVEGFFGVGAIIGPFIVSYLLANDVSWKYLYIVAGILCIGLCIVAAITQYPTYVRNQQSEQNLKQTLLIAKQPAALGFSALIAFYVITEAAIYVWMPSLLSTYTGSLESLVPWTITLFFTLRALGRFGAVWVLKHISWELAMMLFSAAICLCYVLSMVLGLGAAIILLPMSGLFMAMIYPTLNSKGISCFAKDQHGAIAGVILFFTAVAASLGPLLMAIVSDFMGGQAKYGFYVATVFAVLLFVGLTYNWKFKPAQTLLLQKQSENN